MRSPLAAADGGPKTGPVIKCVWGTVDSSESSSAVEELDDLSLWTSQLYNNAHKQVGER